MSVKIKNLYEKKLVVRTCNICGKKREMNKDERFCSPICRQQATDMSKFGHEYRVSIRK
jgi:endogenous inhibitor of DNA gyrase (YacG/DUF329 family)